jgi:hypothetical protein
MTTDEQQPDPQADAEEAALAAGHAEVRGAAVPDPVNQPVDQPVDQPADRPAGADFPGHPEPEASDNSQTLEQRLAALESSFPSFRQGLDSVAGRLGGMNRVLQELREVRASQPQGSAAAAVQKIAVTQLKNLSSDYPELAKAFADDLNEILSAPLGSSPATPQVDVEAIAQRAEHSAIVRLERRLLDREHPNWDADIALKDEMGRPLRDPSGRYLPSPVFVDWLKSKPEPFRQAFVGGIDSDFLSSGLKDFKEFRASRQGQGSAQPAHSSGPAQAAQAPASSSKQARLAAAITPRGSSSGVAGSAALTEDDAFLSGFKSVRG